MTTTTLWTTVRDELRERREAMAHERALRAELAHYSTPEEVEDLLAAVGRVPADDAAATDAALIERILQDNLAEHYAHRGARGHAVGF